MRNAAKLASLIAAGAIGACASAERAAFDPGADPRIGEAVARACVGERGLRGGAPISLAGRRGYLIGAPDARYLLVLSRGCAGVGFGEAPVFVERGDACRREGELVRTLDRDLRPAGGCVIERIYRWREPVDQASGRAAS